MARKSTRGRKSSKKKNGRFSAWMSDFKAKLTPSPTVQTGARIFGWITLAVIIGLGFGIGLPELESRAVARSHNQIAQQGLIVEFINRPALLRDVELQRLIDTTQAAIGQDVSPLQREGLQMAREALLATGWFREIHQVSWRDHGVVEVDAEYSIPVAVVRTRSGDILIDDGGRRLPITYDAGYAPLPVIKNPTQPMPVGFGTPWLGGDVQAGIQLLEVIHREPWFDQVVSIDVGRFAQQNLLALRTRSCTVVWGRPPLDTSVQEVSVDQKIAYLTYLNQQYGAIDAPCGGGELDIRRDVVTSSLPE